MSARNDILAAIPRSARVEAPEIRSWSRATEGNLLQRFTENLEVLGGKVVTLNEVVALTDCWIDEDAARFLPSMAHAEDIWLAQTGITMATAAVAETGTVMIANQPGRHRMSSLLPPRHVVLLRESQIVASLEEAFINIENRTTVLITGTSRTADIEGVLVRGVHGPRELWVCILPEV